MYSSSEQVANSKPIRIGYCLPLTGRLSENGRSARLAHQLWSEDVNARGGLLGRKVELLCADDRSDSALVSGIYAALLDEEKVDLVLGGYGTGSLLPAMPLVTERHRFFVGLMGLGVNNDLHYPGHFAMTPTGGDPNAALTEGFFAVGARQHPKPATIALLSADAEFSRNPVLGAKANAAKYGFSIVDERTYALDTQDFRPLIKAVAASRPDILFLCSYLEDSIGLVRAIAAADWQPLLVGGAMIGPQTAAVKAALGPALNGFVNYEYWTSSDAMMFPGVADLLRRYRDRAALQNVDPLGHYMVPTAYAQLQVLEQSVLGASSVKDADLIDYASMATFDTVMGKIRFGENGEWREPRVVQVQFHDIQGFGIEQFRSGSTQAIVSPDHLAIAPLAYPYSSIAAGRPSLTLAD